MHRRRSFTLIELSLALAMAMILAGAVVPDFVRGVRLEAARKTAMEMSQIAEVARAYYIEKQQWPDSLDALRTAGFLDTAWSTRNPFGNLYEVQKAGALLNLTTTLPADLASATAVLLPMPVINGTRVNLKVTPPGTESLAAAGTIVPWPAGTLPSGWLICDGRAVARADYTGLFAVIGTTYGPGNGSTTFNLPDLRGRTVVGLDNMGGSAANVMTDTRGRSLGGIFGEEAHRLTIAEMPAHTHGYNESPWTGSRYDGSSSPLLTSQRAGVTAAAGGGLAHNNVQPSMALYWIIRS